MVKLYQEKEEFFNRILIQDKDHEYTYMDWKKIADSLTQRVHRRETVLVLSHNRSEILLGILSFLRADMVSILIDASLPQKQIDNTIQLYRPNYLFVTKEQMNLYIGNGFSEFYELEGMALLKNDIFMEPVKNDDLAALLSTSGSTGSPKFVRLSYSNLENNVRYINETVGISKDDGCITVLPLNFLYCLESVLRHVKVGARIIVTDESVVKNEFWDLCKRFHPNYFFGVPYVYETIFKLGIEDYLKDYKTMSIAGGKPSLELISKMNEVAIKNNSQFFVEYGQTEAGGMLAIDIKAKDGVAKAIDHIGNPHPECSIIIQDEENREITDINQEGELIYTGGNVYMGYANDYNDLNNEDEVHSVLHTGDIGIRNKDGMIQIVGRAKRFIKICGKRYSLDYMETCMKGDLNQSGIALSGKDDLLVVFSTEETMIADIKKYLRTQYKLSVKNFAVKYLESFPVKSNGKIDYLKLSKLIAE